MSFDQNKAKDASMESERLVVISNNDSRRCDVPVHIKIKWKAGDRLGRSCDCRTNQGEHAYSTFSKTNCAVVVFDGSTESGALIVLIVSRLPSILKILPWSLPVHASGGTALLSVGVLSSVFVMTGLGKAMVRRRRASKFMAAACRYRRK